MSSALPEPSTEHKPRLPQRTSSRSPTSDWMQPHSIHQTLRLYLKRLSNTSASQNIANANALPRAKPDDCASLPGSHSRLYFSGFVPLIF